MLSNSYMKYLTMELSWNSYHPFHSFHDYSLPKYHVPQSKGLINNFLEIGLDDDTCISFASANELFALIAKIDVSLRNNSWYQAETANETLFTFDIIRYIKFLLNHLPFKGNMCFELQHLYTMTGN